MSALVFGLLFGSVACAAILGSLRHSDYPELAVGLVFGVVSAYLLYSVSDHFKSL